ncbi:alpha/beta fold hydrolase [Flexivirga caeni]|nr:alpha/beta fold hydrolase [Flexivirga caeni]
MNVAMNEITNVLGGLVGWRTAGTEGAPVAVFLHGLGGRRTNWDPQLAVLQDVRRCCAWDQPGYGDSPGLPTSLPELATAAAEWITTLGVRQVDVVGLSFGGMVAQHLTLDYPQLVRTLALLDTSPAFGLDGVTTKEDWMASRVTPLHEACTASERIVAGLVGKDCPAEVRQVMVDSMRSVPAESLAAACRALVDHDTRDRLHQILVPTVVMVGSEDTETPPSYAREIASHIPEARLVEVPEAGHLLNLEDPERVNAELRSLWKLGGAA